MQYPALSCLMPNGVSHSQQMAHSYVADTHTVLPHSEGLGDIHSSLTNQADVLPLHPPAASLSPLLVSTEPWPLPLG